MKVKKRQWTTSTPYIDSTNTTNAASMAVLEKQVEQHIGDNMDHDLITLDGQLGFHAMGQIKVTTPKTPINLKLMRIGSYRESQS